MSEKMNISGAGGGGGGQSTPVEAADSLRSSQYANIIEVVSEGEIEGLVDGLKSIYLDGTPIESASGNKNFEGAEFVFYKGAQVQGTDGVHIGSPGVQSVSDVGVEVKKNAPVIRTVTNPDVDWVKVVIGVPQLTVQDESTGDTNGTAVEYTIELQTAGGGYQTKVDGKIDGKTTSYYKREHKITLPDAGPWDIRVSRVTDDSIKATLQNKTFWSEMIEGVDVKLSYPNSAVCALRMNSEQFKSIPQRGYHIRGLRVKVPVNYDPLTRAYSGAWNGSFKIAWTDNPAWCFYDLLTNSRYGLGEYVESGQVDKWTLYQIAKYCDQMVPDGFGGTEPRFTCNLYLQEREDAFRVINSMASIFRGMVYYADGEILFSQDAPSEPVAIFSPSNVIEGMFTYQGADRRARHTAVLVSWNDPGDMYRQKIEYVADPEGIARWGVIQTELLAVGCTSRGQAHRMGKWLLFTEQHESETVIFRAGMDAVRCAPGDVIKIQDAVRTGVRRSGRILSSTASSLTLDAPVEIQSGVESRVGFILETGMLHDALVTNAPSLSTSVITFSPPAPGPVVPGAMWVLSSDTLVAEQWRILSINEVEPSIVEINALYYNPGKFAAVEEGVSLQPAITSAIRTRPGSVTNLNATNEIYKVNDVSFSTRISVSWTAPDTAVSYLVRWKRGQENERSAEARIASFDIENVPAGTYVIKVSACNNLGIYGETVTIEHIVSTSGVAPDVQNLRLSPNFLGRDMPAIWDIVPGAYEYVVEIKDGATVLRQERVVDNLYTYTYTKNLYDGVPNGPRRSLTIGVKARTLAGDSANWQYATFSNDAPALPLGVQLEPGPGQVSVFAIRPPDEDLQGMIVWMSTSPGFIMSDLTKVYQGSDNAFMKTGLQPAMPHYFRVAFYDAFGTTGLNASSETSSTPTASGGVVAVTVLPLSPADVNDELAVFLDVADTELRGLYGWTGSEWISTSAILAGSVTTDKLAPGAVDYTKLAVGAVQARNLAVKKHFLY